MILVSTLSLLEPLWLVDFGIWARFYVHNLGLNVLRFPGTVKNENCEIIRHFRRSLVMLFTSKYLSLTFFHGNMGFSQILSKGLFKFLEKIGSLPNILANFRKFSQYFGTLANILGAWPKNWDLGQLFVSLTNFWEIAQYVGSLPKK